MPYASGETPEIGDYVKNKWEQPGTVIAIHPAQSGQEQISIRWDDGGVDLPSTSAIEFTLLSRQKGQQPETAERICTDLEVPAPEVIDETPSQELPSQSTLLGAAGEHYVMSQLLRRNYIAALAPQGVPSADIVITDIQAERLFAIQVKSRRGIGSDHGWYMNAKHEEIHSDFIFYCFVDFGSGLDSQTVTYVVPSAVVADVLRESHETWLRTPGKKNQPHKDNLIRRFRPDYTSIFGPDHPKYGPGWLSKYREAWHLFGKPSTVDTESKDDAD